VTVRFPGTHLPTSSGSIGWLHSASKGSGRSGHAPQLVHEQWVDSDLADYSNRPATGAKLMPIRLPSTVKVGRSKLPSFVALKRG